jgi:MoxR-like ATPase
VSAIPDLRAFAVERVGRLRAGIERAIRGKTDVVDLVLAALLARGHVLVEDVPGVGKTTLARALAKSVGCSFHRIQFTSDMLPSDVLGVSIYEREAGRFEFKPGPIFANVVLADEINRAPPKTQSCLLEAMNERQVSIDSQTHRLEEPFVVLATQNPQEFWGTYPLPESQLDRFLLRVRVGYPAPDVERRIVTELADRDPVESLRPVVSGEEVRELQSAVEAVRFEPPLLDYLMSIVQATRESPLLETGVSPRGAMALHRAARAWALVRGRDFCLPDDLVALAVPALAHRVVVAGGHEGSGADRGTAERVLAEILDRVAVPI